VSSSFVSSLGWWLVVAVEVGRNVTVGDGDVDDDDAVGPSVSSSSSRIRRGWGNQMDVGCGYRIVTAASVVQNEFPWYRPAEAAAAAAVPPPVMADALLPPPVPPLLLPSPPDDDDACTAVNAAIIIIPSVTEDAMDGIIITTTTNICNSNVDLLLSPIIQPNGPFVVVAAVTVAAGPKHPNNEAVIISSVRQNMICIRRITEEIMNHQRTTTSWENRCNCEHIRDDGIFRGEESNKSGRRHNNNLHKRGVTLHSCI
jgi:hypothetical protein